MRSSTVAVCGLVYSPHALSRGKVALSSRATRTPARASNPAVTAPAGPAPATITSYSVAMPGLSQSGGGIGPAPDERDAPEGVLHDAAALDARRFRHAADLGPREGALH